MNFDQFVESIILAAKNNTLSNGVVKELSKSAASSIAVRSNQIYDEGTRLWNENRNIIREEVNECYFQREEQRHYENR